MSNQPQTVQHPVVETMNEELFAQLRKVPILLESQGPNKHQTP